MQRRVCFDRISRRRLLIQFRVSRRTAAAVLAADEPNDARCCFQHLGFDDLDGSVSDDCGLYRVWLGAVRPFG